MFDRARNLLRSTGGSRHDSASAVETHFVSGRNIRPPFPEHCAESILGMGCFWGAERLFWTVPGVWVTAVGYAGGETASPSYRAVCSGRTGHAEAVLVVFDPKVVSYEEILKVFWEGHDPTQLNRQGNDIGTQYRSVIFVRDAGQRAAAESSLARYGTALGVAGYGRIATEIADWPEFHHAEDYHQQYLAKNPGGYCGLGGTGVQCAAPEALPSG